MEGKLITVCNGAHAFLPMRRIADAVAEARKQKRPPSTVYSESPMAGGDLDVEPIRRARLRAMIE